MLHCNLSWCTLFPLATMMYVQRSTLANYAVPLIICTWQLYSLPAPGLDPGENKACVSATAQFVPWAKKATVPDFQTGMMSSTTNQEAVEHAATHMAEEKANQKHIMMKCHFVYILEVCSAMQQYTILYYTALVHWLCHDILWSCSPVYTVFVMWMLLPWISTTVLG